MFHVFQHHAYTSYIIDNYYRHRKLINVKMKVS